MNQQNSCSIQGRIGFLGAGSITECIVAGLLKKNLLTPEQILLTNRNNQERLAQLAETFGVKVTTDKREVGRTADILILAIKPKDAAEAIMELRGSLHPGQLVISVIAGVSTALIEEWLGISCPIIRTMPNTSAAVGLSATALACNRHVSEEQFRIASRLLEAIGKVYKVKEEELDIVTGLSGSGPAYIYYLVEAMIAAGTKGGLSPEVSRQLTLQTVLGAAHMLLDTNQDPALLRRQVTSPGGTTQAGVEVLESYQFKEAVISAILRATERSRELGEQYR